MLNLADDRLNAQIKAILTLVSEIDLPRLLEKMMRLVIETAGAEKGVLLLPNQDHWYIEAEGRADQAEVRLLPSIPLETVEDRSETALLSEAVVNYVIQTQQSLVLNDAVNEIQFTRDPYIIRQQPKSVLCMPLLNQGRLTGLLYLENHLATGAFTAERLERLKLLSLPAAISIENARLYVELKNSERQNAQEAAAVANQTTSTFLVNISHELRTPLNAIIGFSELARQNPNNPADTQEQLTIISRSGEQLLSLINQVLGLAKIEAGPITHHPTRIDRHAATLPEHQTQVVGLAPGQPRYRLLIVDDDATNRQLLRQMVTHNGRLERDFELQEAKNGQQAIELWETFAPHLIWMDLRMPVVDGYEATKMIKAKQAAGPNLTAKIIALTASSYEEKRAEVLDIGYDDFLRKPFRKADIFALLEHHLGVQFVYAPPSEHAADSTTTTNQTTAASLAAVPSHLRTRLEKAALSGNMDEIETTIDQIKAHQTALAAQFEQLADAFDYMQIVTILQGVDDE
ncbi:MAG: response regulator [Anaerolineae bacterium]|nr:response regulator [Anaerolineae bacterium]